MVKILLAASIIANGALVFLLFDSAVSLDGSRMQQIALERRLSAGLTLMNVCFAGKRGDEILASLSDAEKKRLLVKAQGEELLVGDFVFAIRNDVVVSVKFLGDQ